jgi:hypothetical protein
MLNYWAVPRPKRKLITVPEVLTTFALLSYNQQWQGQVGRHLDFEEELERAGLKRVGDRRDRGGSGARTYASWLFSLGLIFNQSNTRQLKLTLAGEALMNGDSPVDVLKNQVLKFQFPSSYSYKVGISDRFRIRPFRFLLRLLMDSDVQHLTQDEIAKVITTEATDELQTTFDYVVHRLHEYRNYGNLALPEDFIQRYPSRSGVQTFDETLSRLSDNANVLINWLEYTQLAVRDDTSRLRIVPERVSEVQSVLEGSPPFLNRWDDEEYYQRRYGVDPKHHKDTRNLNNTETITHQLIAKRIVRSEFIKIAGQTPITKITLDLVARICNATGIESSIVEAELSTFGDGALDSFEAAYFDMAHMGREQCREFEIATLDLFRDGFGFEGHHVGTLPKNPDVLVISNEDGFAGIIDTKAYASYSISNDHKNRMVQNYIPPYKNRYPTLGFFMYVAGGFGTNFDKQVREVSEMSGINGAGITASNMIRLLRDYTSHHWTHRDLRKLFIANEEIRTSSFQ